MAGRWGGGGIGYFCGVLALVHGGRSGSWENIQFFWDLLGSSGAKFKYLQHDLRISVFLLEFLIPEVLSWYTINVLERRR